MSEGATNPTNPGRSAGRRPMLGLALLATLLLAGCGDDAGDETTTTGAGGAGTVTSTTLDPSDGTATIPDLPRNEDPSMVVCTGQPKGDGSGVFDATAVVGDPIGAAKQAAADEGCEIRVAVIDGEPQALTEDFRPDRVNVATQDGDVTEIVSIG